VTTWRRLAPRFGDGRFWATQALVVFIAAADAAGDEWWPDAHVVSLFAVILFFLPVTYAALNFGFAGAAATAAWCFLLDAPVVLWHHQGSLRTQELLQLGAIVAVAVFVASRVDRAEAARAALDRSERKYRALFEDSPQPVLLLDGRRTIRDLNPAAARLFAVSRAAALNRPLAEVAGELAGPALTGGGAAFPVERPEGGRVWLAPLMAEIGDERQGPLVQLQLRDVTEERRRQDTLRAYARAVVHAQEEERRRLAHEIHDDTIQSMILLCRRLDSLATAVAPARPDLADGIAELRREAEAIIQALRRLTRALRPTVLDDLGLEASIRQVVEDFRDRTGTDVRFRVTGCPRRLPPEVELNLFRIAQEALRNIEQHAHARRVAVHLGMNRDTVVLSVADDGVGMPDPGTRGLPGGDHLGLAGMRERAQIIGGELRIRSSVGRGVHIRLRVPV
jgi:two-component system sensor histidine kinase UhpB